MQPPLGIDCRICEQPMPAADLLEASSRTVCGSCVAENETVQADMVHELDLFATSSSERIYRKLVEAARLIAKRSIRSGVYDAQTSFDIVYLVAAQVPAEYLRDIGANYYVPSTHLPDTVIGELAHGLFHDWVIPHIQVDMRDDLERHFGGRLPRGLG